MIDVEGRRARAPRRRRKPEPFAARVDRDGQPTLDGRLEDRQVARLTVRALRSAHEQDVDEAPVPGDPADLLGRRGRILRGAHNPAAQPRLFVEPALADPVVMGPRELGGSIRARHERHGDRLVGVQDPDVDAEPVQDVAAHVLDARAGDPPGLGEILPVERVRVHPRVPGQAERLRLDPEPVPLGRVDMREDVPGVAPLDVDVAVDHGLILDPT
jgi:hypothetical protein